MNSRHPLRIVLLWGAAVAVLLAAAWGLPLGYLPASSGRAILVDVQCRDMFEEQIETEILEPLEEAIGWLRGVREVFSVVERDKARVLIRFLDAVDLDGAYLDVREIVEATRLSFPPNVQRPTILKSDGSGVPVFVASFPAEGVDPELVRRAFEQVEGAGEIEVGGGRREEIAVRVDADRLTAARLSAGDVVAAIRAANAVGSLGPASSAEGPWVVDERFRDIAAVQRVVVAPGRLLSDVAEVTLAAARPAGIGRVNASECLVLYAHAAGDANVPELTRRFLRATGAFGGARVLFDAGSLIRAALRELLVALAFGALLVVLVTILFVGRPLPALMVCGTIPVSALAAAAALRLSGQELDLMSLCGIAVGVGMVIDAGLVCLDGYLRADPGARPEALEPVLFSTATTLAVFVPLLFAPETLARRFGGLAVAVAASLVVSDLYVFTLLPALLSLSGRAAGDRSRRAAAARRLGRAAAGRRLGRAAAAAFLLLRRRAVAPAVAALVALAGTGAALAGLPVHEMGHEPEPVLRFSLEFPSGVPAESVFQRSSPLEEVLLRLPGVRGESASYERERARFSVSLRSWADRATVVAWLRGAQAGVPEGFLYLPEGQSDREQFDVTVTGSQTAPLSQVCGALAEELRGSPGVSGVVLHYKEHQPAQVLVLAPQRCGVYGLLPRQIAARLYWALAFPVADKWTTGPIERDIRVGAAAAGSGTAPALEEVLALRFSTPTGALVDARALATIAEEPRPGRVYHLDRRRALSFSLVAGPGSEGRLLRAARGLLASYPLPPGITAVAGAAEAEQAQMLRVAAAGLALAVVLIFLTIMFHFESLRVSLAVMLQLPFSFLLPAWLLRLLRIPLCTTTVMGLILTAGLAVNNAIIVLEGKRARSLRSRPLACALARHAPVISAASLTTVLGALPLLFTPGGQAAGGLLGPLSLTLAAGVLGSLLTLPLGLALAARD